jgi:hypothetical protein
MITSFLHSRSALQSHPAFVTKPSQLDAYSTPENRRIKGKLKATKATELMQEFSFLHRLQKIGSLFKHPTHNSLNQKILSYNYRPVFRISGLWLKDVVTRAFD